MANFIFRRDSDPLDHVWQSWLDGIEYGQPAHCATHRTKKEAVLAMKAAERKNWHSNCARPIGDIRRIVR